MNHPKRLLCAILLGSGVLILGGPQYSFAYQDAVVTEDEAEVYQKPSTDSPRVNKIKKGQAIKASSKWVTDSDGFNWYKVFSGGKFGFVLANTLETHSMKRELASLMVETAHDTFSEKIATTWKFILRGMVGGVSTSGSSPALAGDVELSYAPPFFGEGLWSHLISIGANYLKIVPSDPAFGGVVILRLPVDRLTPEFRVRAGIGQSTNWQLGAAIGLQYPLSRHFGTHLAVYLEAGYLSVPTIALNAFSGSAGLGLHF